MIGPLCLDDAFGNLRIPAVFNEEKIQEQILQGTCVSKCKENEFEGIVVIKFGFMEESSDVL